MQSPEPPDGTSLELTFAPRADEPAGPDTDLVLPPSAPPAMPEPAAPAQAAPGPLGNLVVAHFRRVEVAMLGRVLITTLAGALPAAMIRVERRHRRLSGRAGEPVGITVTGGDRTLTFRAPEIGVTETTVGHTVRGVVLSTTPVPVAQWLDELGRLLDTVSRDDEATRLALERALLPG